MSNKERILVIAHGHPDFSLGGAEIAAYNLFNAYKNSAVVESAWFLGRIDRGNGATGRIHLRRENEYLWEQGIADWDMRSANRDSLMSWFQDLIRQLNPTIVHAHHYVHLGVEIFRVIKEIDPTIKVFLTLHEYLGICANNGQMLKKTGTLCYRSSDEDCHNCFPNRSIEDFWLRRHFIRKNFDFVDGFISPSEFLKERYVDWGLDSSVIEVIENGQKVRPKLPARALSKGEKRTVFGYFGQINQYKGLDVLLKGLSLLNEKERAEITLEIHGANLEKQTSEFQKKILTLVKELEDDGVVRWVGSYRPEEQAERLSGVDWIVVPSVWWENSPMVIQEAFVHGRPPIVSDIGGMSEKVRDGVDGLHVAVANPQAWASTFRRILHSNDLWQKLYRGIQPPLGFGQCAEQHLELFRTHT